MKQEIGRLAMRHEGENWNAYYALQGTMEGSLHLGSIKMRFVQTPERRDAFMALMQEAVGDLLEEITGNRPDWNKPVSAPMHEKAGHS